MHNVDLPRVADSLINIVRSIILGETLLQILKSIKRCDNVNKTLIIL